MLEKLALADLALERKIHAGLDAIENVTGITAQQIKAVLESHIMRNFPSVLVGGSFVFEHGFSIDTCILSIIYFFGFQLLKVRLYHKEKEIERGIEKEQFSQSINPTIRSLRLMLISVFGGTSVSIISYDYPLSFSELLIAGGFTLIMNQIGHTYISNHPGTGQKNSTKDKIMNALAKVFPLPQSQLVPIPVKDK